MFRSVQRLSNTELTRASPRPINCSPSASPTTATIDRGFSGTTRRNRGGVDQARAAVWPDSVFTVTKFDRFARDMAEANQILTDLRAGAAFDPPTLRRGEVSLADLATGYSVGRSTIHRIIHGPETAG
jgi:hypothetical protein